jgi:hypothetical protein
MSNAELVRSTTGPAHPSARSAGRVVSWSPSATTLVLVALVWASGVRGADFPAHEYRAVLWDRAGLAPWNFGWYAGHATPGYGLLSPPLVAAFGTFTVAAVSTVVATTAFTRLLHHATCGRGSTVAAHAFAVVIVVNVVVGRVAFALGFALGLAALRAWQQQRRATSIGLAVPTALTSPVAGAFLLLAATAVLVRSLWSPAGAGLDRRPTPAIVGVIVAAGVPIVATVVLFGDEGVFPFRAGHLVVALAVCVLVLARTPFAVVRVAAVLLATAMLGVFVVPNALGGNVVRVVQIVGVPLAVAWSPRVRGARARLARLVVGGAAVGWALLPGVVAVAAWGGDPTVQPEFHDSLIRQVRSLSADGKPVGRVEIPFTLNHWESWRVAVALPYARGWERQVDLVRNPELYAADLSVADYHAWLRRNAVRWIAIPDAPLDHGGVPEALAVERALTAGVPWLRPAWRDDRWQLYEVLDYVPIVDRPADLVAHEIGGLVIRAGSAIAVRVRIEPSAHLTITPPGRLCVADGELMAVLPAPGTYRIGSSILARSDGARCP